VDFSFAGRTLPMTIRMCRSLVWTQAALVVLGGAFVILAATVFGSGNEVPFNGSTLSGTSAIVLGFVYVAAGLLLSYLGFELGRLAPWVRNVLVSAQVLLVVLLVLRTFDLSVSTVLNLAFCAAIVGLLLAPDTSRALDAAASSRRPPSADPV
jgi:hypothetical protein